MCFFLFVSLLLHLDVVSHEKTQLWTPETWFIIHEFMELDYMWPLGCTIIKVQNCTLYWQQVFTKLAPV